MSAATAPLYQNLHMENFLASNVASSISGKQVSLCQSR